jgi:hypothetical protein
MIATIFPPLTFDELVRAALHDRGALAAMVKAKHPTQISDMKTAASAVEAEIEDWCFVMRVPVTAIPEPLKVAAMIAVRGAGWDAREAADQLSFEFDRPITAGAARYEMLEGV